MNIVLPTRKEEALAGMPGAEAPIAKNQTPNEDGHGRGGLAGEKVGRWEKEKRGEGGKRSQRGQASPFPSSDVVKDAVLTPAAGGEAEFLRLLFEFTHSVQLNPDRTVALAAKRWERSLRFKLAVTRQKTRGKCSMTNVQCPRKQEAGCKLKVES